MAKSKVVVIPVVTDTEGTSYKLLTSSLREDRDNKNSDVQSITKTQLRKVFAAKGAEVTVATQYRHVGGVLHDVPIEYSAYVVNRSLQVGCRYFDEATTRKIRRWLGTAKKAA